MDFFRGGGSRIFISFRLDNEMSGQPKQDVAAPMETNQQSIEPVPAPEITELPVDKRSIVELLSTSDSESCEAYISRKVESLQPAPANPNDVIPGEGKVSMSDPVTVTPCINELIPEPQTPDDVPKVVFLNKPEDLPQVASAGIDRAGNEE